MSSEIKLKCWLCPETYGAKKELKDHAIEKHDVCRMVCPWCVDEERSYGRMSELTKHTKRKHNNLVLDLLDGDFFTEKNGFWLAKRPKDYARIITPSEWTSTMAIRTRAALLGWVDGLKKKTSNGKTREQWEDGWNQALGIQLGNRATGNRKRKTPPYSPTRPGMDYPKLNVSSISLTTKSKVAYLRMEEAAAEVWFKVELVHWVMEDRKAKDNLLRRMTATINQDHEPPETFPTELKLEEAKHTITQVTKSLGINDRHIRRLCTYRGRIRFELNESKARKVEEIEGAELGEEPEYEIMDYVGEEEEVQPKEDTGDKRVDRVQDVKDMDASDKNEQPEENKEQHKDQAEDTRKVIETSRTEEHIACTTQESYTKMLDEEEKGYTSEVEDEPYDASTDEEIDPVPTSTTQERAEGLLKKGGMPLFPPGRREWEDKQVVISTYPTEMHWPPKDWKKLTPEEKMTSWRFAAMSLAREQGTTLVTRERDVLDTFAMLALPGTPVSHHKGTSPVIDTRLANYNMLRDICLGKITGADAEGIVGMLEAATDRKSSHPLVEKIQHVPLRLAVEEPAIGEKKQQQL